MADSFTNETIYNVVNKSLNWLHTRLSTAETKLSGIASGAEVNQNAFSNVTIGSTTIAADTKTDTLTVVAGSDITLTPNADNDSFSVSVTSNTFLRSATLATGTNDGTVKLTTSGTTATAQDNIKVKGWDNVVQYTSGTAVGGTAQPVYVTTAGKVTALSDTKGAVDTPVYMSAGTITPLTVTAGSATQPVYFSNGKVVAGTTISAAGYMGVTSSGLSTASTTDHTSLPTVGAVAAFVSGVSASLLSTADALTYKGVLSATSNNQALYTSAGEKGQVYKVSVASGVTGVTVNGVAVENGDMLICNADGTSAGTSTNASTIAENWDVIQSNIDVATAVASDGRIPTGAAVVEYVTSVHEATSITVANGSTGDLYSVASLTSTGKHAISANTHYTLNTSNVVTSGTGEAFNGLTVTDGVATLSKGFTQTDITLTSTTSVAGQALISLTPSGTHNHTITGASAYFFNQISDSASGDFITAIGSSNNSITVSKGSLKNNYATVSIVQGSNTTSIGPSGKEAGLSIKAGTNITLSTTSANSNEFTITAANVGLTTSGTGAFVRTVSSSGNTLTVSKGNAVTSEVTACTGFTSAAPVIDATSNTIAYSTISTSDSLNAALAKVNTEGEVAVNVYNAFAAFYTAHASDISAVDAD